MGRYLVAISDKRGRLLPKVVIVGAGFGGLRVTSRLRNAPVRVTLIDRRNYHLFQPLLYQVATAALGPTDIAQPIRAILRGQKNLEFRVAQVAGINLETKTLRLDAGEVAYDFLVIAVGGQTNYFGNRSLAQHAFGLKDLDDAVRIRNHVLNMFELAVYEKNPQVRRALLTFVIVGGGPTGVECAGAFSELIRLVLIKDYLGVSMKDMRIVLLEADDKLLSMMPESLREAAAKTLWSKYVEVRFGAQVADFDGRGVTLKSGEKIPAHTMVWAAGVRAEELTAKIGLPTDRLGRIKVGRTLQLPDHPEVFVIGDAASPRIRTGMARACRWWRRSPSRKGSGSLETLCVRSGNSRSKNSSTGIRGRWPPSVAMPLSRVLGGFISAASSRGSCGSRCTSSSSSAFGTVSSC